MSVMHKLVMCRCLGATPDSTPQLAGPQLCNGMSFISKTLLFCKTSAPKKSPDTATVQNTIPNAQYIYFSNTLLCCKTPKTLVQWQTPPPIHKTSPCKYSPQHTKKRIRPGSNRGPLDSFVFTEVQRANPLRYGSMLVMHLWCCM